MAKFLTTSGVSYEVEMIIKTAKKKLVLISPYIQLNKMLLERLQNASDKGVQIFLIYGKKELNVNETKQLNKIENLKLYFYINLHAKCYFNESSMVLTSMNLYDFSEKNNREMGVLITKKDDEVMFKEVVEETSSIKKSATEIINKNKLPLIFPLKEDNFKYIHEYLKLKHKHCKVNSTTTYVYCEDLFPFGDLMIREGFEIRLNYNLYSEELILKKIKGLKIKGLNYDYEINILDDMSRIRILIETKNANDLDVLLKDYSTLYVRIIEITKNISTKCRSFF